jgi:hypothetical protein
MKTDIATTDLERRGRNVDAALPPPASTLFEVAHRGGIWEVTKDGRFYGHYHSQQPASTPSRHPDGFQPSGQSCGRMCRVSPVAPSLRRRRAPELC